MAPQPLIARQISDAGLDLFELDVAPPVQPWHDPSDQAGNPAPAPVSGRALPLAGQPGNARRIRWWAWASVVRRRRSSGVAISALVHATVLIALSLVFVIASQRHRPSLGLVATLREPATIVTDGEEHVRAEPLAMLLAPQPPAPDNVNPIDLNLLLPVAPGRQQPVDPTALFDPTETARRGLFGSPGTSGGLQGRSGETKTRLLHQRGGTPESEQAVSRGLAWLAAHQRDDGSWRFNHHGSRCPGYCSHPGTEPSTTAATAMALLPFLGAGQTHRQGDYREVVEKGLYYLVSRLKVTDQGGDLQEGTMYAQGLATIALCEACAMTGDDELRQPAEQAVEFIVSAQDRNGGGWRYFPGQVGDTTSFGWQLMALKSGQLAGISAPGEVFALARKFLDSVESESGAYYGYQRPEYKRQPTTTSVGLLCRMYLGWKREHSGLSRGVEYLARQGPSRDNLYFDYYATQVLNHYEGQAWERWNPRMRDFLIATQQHQGHEAGSWHFRGGHGDVGGRLYNTALATMILEVYYRYMPLYGRLAVEQAFD